MTCTQKHVVVPDDPFECPRCGASTENGEFYIESQFDTNCELFHPMDTVSCTLCGGAWSLKTILKKYYVKHNLVKCECCNGTGYVPGKK